ncbi:related to Nuclear pore complex protein Nup214 [Melanopsichium pennsylvanicum]|uniref:Related to Nuclear pore complex protein Nup214 n=2 Tax=Melanopsichium pennsylvanicum TaxID=63383 RepID=A0AAJ4XT86_9BASI|nr:related to Nuclear pore complex protein Nup214 [Melanopsichium pennsylvanicum 4]SNX86693.1 related to Nuclear pore complex protein Nup214 [Melanopsichium pennsylvanicum]
MDFPAQYPDSPAKPLAGPARARVLARQNRTSSLKPYSRPSLGITPSGSSTSLHTDTDSPARQPSTPAKTQSLAPPSAQTRSAFSPLRVAASPIALLGNVRKMVTRPLAWLTTAAAAVEPELGIPTSSSTNSLSSIARKRAAAQASINANAGETSYERDASTSAARAVGERLAAGLRSRTNLQDDEESQLRPVASNLSSSVSMSRLAPGPAPAPTTRKHSPVDPASPLVAPSSLPKTAHSDKAATWSNRSSKRRLDLGSRFANPDDSLEVLSDAAPASPPQAQPYHFSSHHTLRSPRSQLLRYRGSSLRPDDAVSESASTSLSHSASFNAFGYGSEVRYADSAFGLPPSSSPFQLSSRNAASRRNRAPFSSGLFTDAGTPGRTSWAGSVSLRSASPAPSAGYSPARAREATPQRRNWNGINLAAPSAPIVGDEMMREYLQSRTLPGINPIVRRTLGLPVEEPMMTASSVAGGSVMDETESLTPNRLGKRDIDMSVDGDSERLGAAGTPSKRRMVWHPELGFISHEELKSREPKPPTPKNEAERLLNVLETLRKPTNTSRGLGSTNGPPTSINVPAPISDLPTSVTRNTKSQEGKPSVGVAPYTRYLRKAKAIQSTEEQGGMRAKLKKTPRANNRMETDDAATEESAASENEGAEEQVEVEEEKEEPAPQPEPVRRSRRLQHQAPAAEDVVQTPFKSADKPVRTTQLKSALKATPLRPTAQPQATPAQVAETPRPASHRIALSAASKPPSSVVKKDNFAVKTSSDPSAPRERSSLRQGAAKTSRQHQSSGKFSAWDEDEEEEDLPDANELAKIKLPTNMFPSGFSFGNNAPAAASATSAGSEPKATTTQTTTLSTAPSVAGGSLLGRLGGFDSSSAANQPEKKQEPKPAESSAAPSFSFPAPSKDAPNAMPKFSFGAAATPSTTTKDDTVAAKKSNASTASDFFSKPAQPVSTTLSEARKDGPVPNFFGSTMKKFESKSDAPAPEARSATGSGSDAFSFGPPATSTGTKANDKSAFSFGTPKPVTESSTTSAPVSDSYQPFSAKPSERAAESKANAAAAGQTSFFGSSSSTTASGAGGFSFGTLPTTVAPSTGSKRSADDDDEPAAKKSMPSFSFGSSAVSKPTESSTSPAPGSVFSFGAPAASAPAAAGVEEEKKDEAPKATADGVANFFGAQGEGASKPAIPAAPSSGGFSFGKPADSSAATSGGLFGASKPADATSSGSGFTFGTPKPATDAHKAASSGFTFGSLAGSPAPESKSAGSTSTFTFGATKLDSAAAGATSSASSASASASASGATKPNGTFLLGSNSTGSTENKPAGSTSGFSFGAINKASGSTGFGGGGESGGFGGFGAKSDQPPANGNAGSEMMDDSPQKSAPVSSTPSFTFGSATPVKPAGGMSFTFGTPTTSGVATGGGGGVAGGSPAPFTFGAPAADKTTAGSGGGFRFGSSAPAASGGATNSSATGFTFGSTTTPGGGGIGGRSTTPGVGSTPASPFLGPSGAPTTPGGSPFQFGAPQPASSAPFQFGAPAPASASSLTPSAAGSGGFSFGGSAPSSTTGVITFGGSTPTTTFGGSGSGGVAPGTPSTGIGGGDGGFGTPNTAASGFSFGTQVANGMIPQMPQMPQQASGGGGMFSIGAPPPPTSATGANNSPAPGGRQIKPLRQRRR